jgi:L-alanine-DL-glutamate epimerase-like enolase superfamily enzyme
MNQVLIDAFEYDASQSDALQRITKMCEVLTRQSARVAELEEELKAAKADKLRMEREDLPDLMKELQITQITLENGASVKVEEKVEASITEENRPAALQWLKAYHFDGIIKAELSVQFGREEYEKAEEIRDAIEEQFDVTVDIVEMIHPSTVKSFAKERREADMLVTLEERQADALITSEMREADPTLGVPIPPPIPHNLFGIFVFDSAKITMPKEKKSK